jgi:uncharacterized membrane protein
MALTDLYSNFHLFFRWLHVLAGIIWIGHLYFFNFVNGPLQAVLDDPTKKLVNPKLMPRALWWFRWGAMITFLAGLILFTQIYMYTPGQGFGPSSAFSTPDGHLSGRALWILLGMGFGTIMWFNVWFIIWPTQKALLSGKVPQDKLAVERAKAARFSRINTYLSAPMLVGMLAPNHYGAISAPMVALVVALGFAIVWHLYKIASKVGHSV